MSKSSTGERCSAWKEIFLWASKPVASNVVHQPSRACGWAARVGKPGGRRGVEVQGFARLSAHGRLAGSPSLRCITNHGCYHPPDKGFLSPIPSSISRRPLALLSHCSPFFDKPVIRSRPVKSDHRPPPTVPQSTVHRQTLRLRPVIAPVSFVVGCAQLSHRTK